VKVCEPLYCNKDHYVILLDFTINSSVLCRGLRNFIIAEL
jgi:hypothetical protein